MIVDQPVRVGIAGLGRSGWGIHAAAVGTHPGFVVTAVADPVPDRLKEAADRFDCATFTSPEELIAYGAVDLVVIATPSHTHVSLALAALKAERHVLVEKPMAEAVADVDSMIAVADRAGLLLTCYQPRRLDPDFRAVQEAVKSGRLGDIVLVRRTLHRFDRRADWQTLRRFGGGELANTAPHLLDQVLAFAGDGPLEVFADLRQAVSGGDAEDHVKLCLRSKKGPMIDVECSSTVALPQPGWFVVGTAGALTVTRDSLTVRWHDPATLDVVHVDEGPAAGRRYGSGEQIDWHEEITAILPGERPLAVQFYDHLQQTLAAGAEPLVTSRAIRRQVDVLERARAASAFV